MKIFLVVIILFAVMHLYLKVALKCNIIDKPNIRSSHDAITIRGGGIIFPISICIYSLFTGFYFPWFLIGLFAISFISFLDDLYSVSNRLRIVIHLISVAFLFIQSNLVAYPIWIIFAALIFVIGIINAYNFMDGINGITVLYSLSIFISFFVINKSILLFISPDFFLPVFASLFVFAFYNVRTKAKTFAGDVGSVSIAFIIAFLLIILMIKTQSVIWILLLLFYGIDTVITIIFRLLRKENIFNAHRSHYFQFLANEKRYPHVIISTGYAVLQLAFNGILIYSYKNQNWYFLLIILFIITIFYFTMRLRQEGLHRLIKEY